MGRPVNWTTFVQHARAEMARMAREAIKHVPMYDDLCTCSRPTPCSALTQYRAAIDHYQERIDAGPLLPVRAPVVANTTPAGFPYLWGARRRTV